MADLRDVAEWIDGLERGVLAHQHSPQAGFTAFPDRLDQFDEEGNWVATLGRLPDGTFGVQPAVPVPPPSPTGPVVECDLNQVSVSWNGMFADEDGDGDPDVVEPSTLSHIAVFSRYLGTLDGPAGEDGEPSLVPAEGEPDVARGSIAYTAQAGGQLSFGPVVETGLHEVWLCAVGSDGGVSAPSERARFEVTYGLLQGELDEVRLRADGAMLSADGKNSVWRQDAAPVPSEEFPISEGDIWFHTGESNMPHVWDGSGWVSAADERVDAVQSAVESMRDELDQVVVGSSGVKVFYKPTSPDADDASVDDLWFDTSAEGKNMPHRWDGESWVSVADQRVEAVRTAMESMRGDLEGQIEGAAGNKVTWSAAAPPSGAAPGKAGDTWFQVQSGRVTGQWAHDGSSWVSRPISHEVIASVDLGKATVGELDGGRIRAGSVTADKLLVGTERNLIPNGDLSAGNTAGWPNSAVYATEDPPPGHDRYVDWGVSTSGVQLAHFGRFPVTVGDEIVVELWIKADKPDSVTYIEARDQDGVHIRTAQAAGWVSEGFANDSDIYVVGKAVVPTEWTLWRSRLKITSPATTEVYLNSFYRNHSAGSERGARLFTSGIRLFKSVGSTLIEDGAITTEKIAAGAITAESGVIGSLDLGKATVGELDGARVKAGSVTADKLLVGGALNLIPGLEPGGNKGFTSMTWDEAEKALKYVGSSSRTSDGTFKLPPGEYVVEADIKASVAGTRTYAGVAGQADTPAKYKYGISNVLVGTEWQHFSAPLIINEGEEGTFLFRLLPAYEGDGTATTWYRNLVLRPRVGATLIADGAVTTEKIATGAITAESGIIGSLDLGKATVGQLNGDRILANSISSDHIRSGAVTATSLSADALNGKTITGATVQTSTGYPRVAMDKQGLHAWDQAGRKTFDVDQNTGAVSAVGEFMTGRDGQPRVKIDPDDWASIAGVDEDGNPINMNGAGIAIEGAKGRGLSLFHGAYNRAGGNGLGEAAALVGPGRQHLYMTDHGHTWIRQHEAGSDARSELYLWPQAARLSVKDAAGSVVSKFRADDYGAEMTATSGDSYGSIEVSPGAVTMSGGRLHFTSKEPVMGQIRYLGEEQNWSMRYYQIVRSAGGSSYVSNLFGEIGSPAEAGAGNFGIIASGRDLALGSDRGGKVAAGKDVVLSGGKIAINSSEANLGWHRYEGTGASWAVRYYKGSDWFGEIGSPGGMFAANSFGVVSKGDRELELWGHGAHLRLRSDATSPCVVSKTIYDRTYSGSGNVYVTSYGTLGRISSARKYKAGEQVIDPDGFSDALLSIPFKSWLDREELKRWEVFKKHVEEKPGCPVGNDLAECPQDEPRRHIGAVAEDFVDAGLSEFVTFDEFGEPDGLQYDRIGVALIPVVAGLRDRVDALEAALAGQKQLDD